MSCHRLIWRKKMRAVLSLAALATLLISASATAQPAYEGEDDGDYVADEPGVTYDPANYSIGYYGPHPVPYDQVTGQGGGYCYTEGPHTHDYLPFDEHLFRVYNGYYYFVGDPVDFGWNRPVYTYQANHPIPVNYGSGYCYITWPHRHGYEPIGLAGFTFLNGSYVFTGTWPTDYWYYRNYYWGYYQRYYRTWYSGNRYYQVRPRPIYTVSRPYRVAAPPGRVFVSSPPPARRYGYGVPRGQQVPAPPAYGRPGRPYPNGNYNNGNYNVPPPAYGAPNRGYVPAATAPPVYRNSSPGYQVPPPAYRNPAPAYQAPVYRAPAPAYRGSSPVAPPVYRAPAAAPVFRGGGTVAPPPAFRR
jgi:hypothetical protein